MEPSARKRFGLAGYASVGILVAATGASALWNPLWRHAPISLGVLALAGLAWACCVILSERANLGWRDILIVAVVLRVCALLGSPELSDDLHRYVWEGKIVALGSSPYAHAPEDEHWRELREQLPETYEHLNNRDVSAAYPPATQGVLGASMALCDALGIAEEPALRRALRVLFSLCDLFVLWPLSRLLRLQRSSQSRLVVWAWSPLVALEFGASGHFDSLGILALVGGLALFATHSLTHRLRELAAAFLVSTSILVKWLPLCAVPFVLRGEAWRRRAVLLLATCAFWLLPFVFWEEGTQGIASGITEYGTRWEGFNFVYSWIEAGIDASIGGERDRSLTDPRVLGRALISGIWFVRLVQLWLRNCETTRAVGELLGWFLLLSPTLHPWYLTWIVPFLALRLSWAWLWVVALSGVLYSPLRQWHLEQVWADSPWVWPSLVTPAGVLFALQRRSEENHTP